MSPVVKRSLAGIAVAASAGFIIVGAAVQLLGFPGWTLWALGGAVALMWLSARPRTAPFMLGFGILAAALYFGLPLIVGQIARAAFSTSTGVSP